MQTRPRFRNDLVAQPVFDAGQRFVDVTDPDSGSTFRFYEVEYAVACAMDGKRDTGGLVAWSKAELGLEPSAAEIETVVGTLEELGYLAAVGDAGDFELGVAGKSDLSAPRAPVKAESVELGSAGTSGSPEVSVDLSQHLSIDKDDVKEAVRQSRVMDVPAAPADFDDDATAVAEAPPSAVKASAAAAIADAMDDDEVSGAKPIEIPAETPSVKPKAPAAPAPAPAEATSVAAQKSGSSMTVVLVVLLIAILGAGGYFAYTQFIAPKADDASSMAPTPTQPAATAAAKKKLRRLPS